MRSTIVNAGVLLIAASIAGFHVPAACADNAGSVAADWGPLAFLVGTWTGDEGGVMGKGTATISFTPELGGELLVRRHRIQYPPSRKVVGTTEEDFMVLYRDDAGKPARAVLFDTDHHEMHFTIEVSADGNTITLTSDAEPSVERHRMIWTRQGGDGLAFTGLLAPPESPDQFATQTAGTVHRK